MASRREAPGAAPELLRGQPWCVVCWRCLLLLGGAACWGAAVVQQPGAAAGRRGAWARRWRLGPQGEPVPALASPPAAPVASGAAGAGRRRHAARGRGALLARPACADPAAGTRPQVLGADGMLYQTTEDLLSVGHELNPAIQQFEASCFNGAPGGWPGARPRAMEQGSWCKACDSFRRRCCRPGRVAQ
jgi:hypothetical protein